LATWRAAGTRSQNIRGEWQSRLAANENRAEFERRMAGTLPAGFADAMSAHIRKLTEDKPKVASRKASQMALEVITKAVPEALAGSADLTHSNLTNTPDTKPFQADSRDGRYMMYGIREHGMAAAMNGIALHGGLIPYGGTFMVFTDYARPSIRLSALMGIRSIYVMTPDSIGLGEDGPTHQPVEQTATLRMIPNMDVWRPCDTVESAVSWVSAVEKQTGPSSLIFSRQNLNFQKRDDAQIANIAKGGYVLADAAKPKVVLIATGSEVQLALDAKKVLDEQGVATRVVSMPSTNVFDRQDQAYKDSVLLKGVKRVAVEAGIMDGWYKYVGDGATVGMTTFGESAPAPDLFKHFGFTVENVVNTVKGVL
ncbi:MAG: transketolase C-terminal domain-containing protein, partial [Sulfurimicrobium sp.]|nr:transketolase C-terminal domain-containing protein [Sulfurimicrobium sp.]